MGDWDWGWLFYVATVILNRSEDEFWQMTPRKFYALFDVHVRIHGGKDDGGGGAGNRGNWAGNSGSGASGWAGERLAYIDEVL